MTIYRGASVPGTGNTTDAAASDITIDDAGAYYSSTNVEDALQEEAANRREVESDLALHLIDYTNPHQVTADQVSITDAGGNFTATDVEAALAEEADARQSHEADTNNPHSVVASQVSITDAGGYYTSTDVEGALQEVPGLISASSLDYFVEGRDTTASINDTVPVHSWEVTGTETDIDIALVPKGTGAITAHVPDGTVVGGNKRGAYAVDLQTGPRMYNYRVASGSYSCTLGTGNMAGGTGSFSVGYNNDSAGSYSISMGNLNSSSGESSFAAGSACYATGDYSVSMGNRGSTRQIRGKFAFSGSLFGGTVGLSQTGFSIQGETTSDATSTILTTQAVGATPGTFIVEALPDNHTYAITATVTARDTSTGDSKIWKIEGAAKRGTGASTVALVGTPTKAVIAEDTGASAWDCDLVVNTTRGSVEVEVTGEASTTIHWVCKFDTVEVG